MFVKGHPDRKKKKKKINFPLNCKSYVEQTERSQKESLLSFIQFAWLNYTNK